MGLARISSLFFGVLLCLMASSVRGQFGPDHVVISPSVLASTPIQVSAPVIVCFHGDPLAVIVNSSAQVTGNVVTLTVNTNWSGICFAAGDPAVRKAVSFTLSPLPVGTYSLNYKLNNFGVQIYSESVSFDVVGALAAIPASSQLSLALIVLVVLGVAFRYRRRPAP